jgi:CBS domain containing-hemolysin-like protein
LLSRLDSFLAATQLGVTMAALSLGWIGAPVIEKIISHAFFLLRFTSSGSVLHTISIVISFSLVTFLEVIFGELLPKWSVIQQPERAARFIAYPMTVFLRAFRPLIWLLQVSASGIATLLGINPTAVGAHETAHSEEEIMAIVEAAEKSGTISSNEAEIVDNVFEFTHTTAREIMVPRVDIVTLSTDWTIHKNVEVALESGFTRFPVCKGDRDNIIGMVHVKDLAAIASNANASLETIRREIPAVPETKRIDRLLKELQLSGTHQAVILDEYGGTAGLVTIEDILEELVGEIQDEYDRPVPIFRVDDHTIEAAASVTLDEIEAEMEIKIDEREDLETIGGFAMHKMHIEATVGAEAMLATLKITVIETQGQRIRRLRVERTTRPHDDEPPAIE